MHLTITTGKNRKDRRWKQHETTWADFVAKLTDIRRTKTTMAEYLAMKAKPKSEAAANEKDVGGYVGGTMIEGARKAHNVIDRQLVTLDIDFAELGFEHELPFVFPYEYFLHSTHSHSETNPRYRLIIPLDEAVGVDKYEAIARKIAELIDIELFDTTTFQASRLMYWSSVTKDGVYVLDHNEGDILSAEDTLNLYDDWSDTSKWAISDKAIRKHLTTISKQSDPTAKSGPVGAFCKTFTIVDAIENFLSDAYDEGHDGRYTFVEGTTANGLVIYDEMFSYSHHSTDPTSMLCCNAFDLVRLHKFGHLDDGSKKEGVRLPSFEAMVKFCKSIKSVNAIIVKENLGGAFDGFPTAADDDFDGFPTEDDAEAPDDWYGELETDKNGKILASSLNIDLILEKDENIGGAFAKNAFSQHNCVLKDLPWRKIVNREQLKDVDLNGVRNYIDREYKFSSSAKLDDSMAMAFQRNSFHPVKEYLNEAVWDGTPRVDTLLIDYFGVSDTPYHRESIRKVLCAGIARIFRPACKFDLVLTLVGGQGSGKSTLVKKLGGEWFSDSLSKMEGKDAFQQIQNAWIIELAELSAMKKAEIENVKHFITKQEDSFRLPYGRVVETFKRQCIFIGTTNKIEFLSDDTGNRRFLPIMLNTKNAKLSIFDLSKETVKQIWAEAKTYYDKGEKLFLSGAADRGATSAQRAHSVREEQTGAIEAFLERPIMKNWYDISAEVKQMALDAGGEDFTEKRMTITTVELWVEFQGKNASELDRYKSRTLNSIMRTMDGWTFVNSAKKFGDYGRQKYYKRDEVVEDLDDIL